MSTISITLPDEDLQFLRQFARARGDSAENLLARQARQLRMELQRPLHGDVLAATGVFQHEPDWRTAAEKKHQ